MSNACSWLGMKRAILYRLVYLKGERLTDQQDLNMATRNERGELDVVRLSWDQSEVVFPTPYPSSNFLPEIQKGQVPCSGVAVCAFGTV